MTFLVNLMFRRLDNFDGSIFGNAGMSVYAGGFIFGNGCIYGGLIFGMLIRLHICGAYIRERLIYRGHINGVLRYLSAVSSLAIITGQSIEFI